MELTILDPKEFGLVETQTTSIEEAFKPKRIESDTFAAQYEVIVKQELNPETFKQARELRLKLVKVRTGIADVHKTEKAFFLASGKFVDALKNKLTLPIEQMEDKLAEIEQYEIRLAKEAKEKLKTERLDLLAPYEVDTTFVSIEEMTAEQFNGFLSTNKLAFETKAENERLAEVARIEAEKKAEEDRKAKELADKLERERIEKENAELKKQAEEKEKQLAIEHDRLAKEQAEKDRLAKIESDKQAKINADLKAKADKAQAELKAKEDADKLKQEQERQRIEAEEAEKLAKEKALLLAPDKDKVKAFAIDFARLDFPELTTKQGKQMAERVKIEIEKLKAFINAEYKLMK